MTVFLNVKCKLFMVRRLQSDIVLVMLINYQYWLLGRSTITQCFFSADFDPAPVKRLPPSG